MRFIWAIGCLLSSCAAFAAGEPFPQLSAPDTSNPAVAAFVAWHSALLKGDFAAYRRLTPVIPNMNEDLLRQMFDQLRSTAPKSVKVTTPAAIGTGVKFDAVGCIGNRPVISVVTAGNQSGSWQVAGSGWGPSWNPKISEFVKCP